jgi:hypothetical protein
VAEIGLMSGLEYEYWKVYFKLDAEEEKRRMQSQKHNTD